MCIHRSKLCLLSVTIIYVMSNPFQEIHSISQLRSRKATQNVITIATATRRISSLWYIASAVVQLGTRLSAFALVIAHNPSRATSAVRGQ
jgi:hypothetical protein